jgi:peptidylprolyl isomerase
MGYTLDMSRNKYHKRRQRKQKSKTKWIILIAVLLVIVAATIIIITLNKSPIQYNLTIAVDGNGNTSPTQGVYEYNEGSVISIEASANEEWTFNHWLIDGVDVGSSNPFQITMDSNQALLAVFTENNSSTETNTKVMLQTSLGDILIELRNDMPITTTNFKNLVEDGVYDGTIFHRVIADFMIQGGDPNGNGLSDDGIPTIIDEFTNNNKNDRGTIAMANAGANTGSSQFFINVVNNNYLDDQHPVFGKVIMGMDVVDTISNVETDPNDKPITPVSIISAYIVD